MFPAQLTSLTALAIASFDEPSMLSAVSGRARTILTWPLAFQMLADCHISFPGSYVRRCDVSAH